MLKLNDEEKIERDNPTDKEQSLELKKKKGCFLGNELFNKSSDNYNFSIIEENIMGHSIMKNIIANFRLKEETKVRLITDSYEYDKESVQVEQMNAQIISFKEEEPKSLNFFTRIALNKKNRLPKEEIDQIVKLIKLMAYPNIDFNQKTEESVIDVYLYRAIEEAFKREKRNAGLIDIVYSLKYIQALEREKGSSNEILDNLIIALYHFGDKDGKYVGYFNNESELRFNKDFIIFDLSEIEDENLKIVLVSDLIDRIDWEFKLSSRDSEKYLLFENAENILKNKKLSKKINDYSKRIRRNNGGIGVAIQNLNLIKENKDLVSLVDNSNYKIFTKSSKRIKINKILDISKKDYQKILSLESKEPFYVEIAIDFKYKGIEKIKLYTEKQLHWLFTNHIADMKKIYNLIREEKLTETDARIRLGRD